jgi:hypothetical protein
LGCSVRPVASFIDEYTTDFKGKKYALIPNESTKTIYVFYQEDCSSKEMLESYALAVFAALLANGSVFQNLNIIILRLPNVIAIYFNKSQFSTLTDKFSGDIADALRKMVKDNVWTNGFQDALVAQCMLIHIYKPPISEERNITIFY